MSKLYIVYHKIDFDGICSASIIYNYYKDTHMIKMIPMDYNDTFDLWDNLNKDDLVFIVDFSLNMHDMYRLNRITNLVWIDHHESAIKEYEESYIFIAGIREWPKLGACALVWEYFYDTTDLPKGIEHIAKYDVFDRSDPDTELFQYGLLSNAYAHSCKSYIWTLMDDSKFISDTINNGKITSQYHKNLCKVYCDKFAFEAVFETPDGITYNTICLNAGNGGFNSQAFESVYDKKKHDFMVLFSMLDHENYHISLYTDTNINVGEVASLFNGGGHAKAAGFECKKLPIIKYRI